MRFPPPAVIATWPKPNYVHPQTRGPALLVVALIFMSLAIVCVALRVYLMVAAALFTVGVTVDIILADQLYGWDTHVWDLTAVKIIKGRQASLVGQTLFSFASGLAKASILLSYLRFAPDRSLFRHLIYASLGLVVACIMIYSVVLWTQCRPSSSYWDLYRMNRDCISEGPPLMAQSIITVLTDVLVYILPMPTLYSLGLPLFQRNALMILFGIGGVVIVAGIMRIYWTHYVVYETYDVTWNGFCLWIWTAVEVNLGVICGCIPSLRPLMFHQRFQVSAHGNHGSTMASLDRSMTQFATGTESVVDRFSSVGTVTTVTNNGDGTGALTSMTHMVDRIPKTTYGWWKECE
ncbi:hypothetical protein NA57DRAFT_64878 [Rhizodiscina lignyota]|uniref:Rhodopsin domain-containing protein n=1 Tax=Rhizodiscina lignyota TaxID=1504668 RepID=A0A9P4IIG9_9PEZI|nr:hypothetical protein NA57DRAFT_64878 [Rhizodiscina lignyota]